MPRTLKGDHAGRAMNLATLVGAHDSYVNDPSVLRRLDREVFDHLTTEQIAEVVGMIRAGEAGIRVLRAHLEAKLHEARMCEMCPNVVSGRADRKFCSAACRQKALRLRRNS